MTQLKRDQVKREVCDILGELLLEGKIKAVVRPDGQIGYAPAWWNPDGERREEIRRENDKKVC